MVSNGPFVTVSARGDGPCRALERPRTWGGRIGSAPGAACGLGALVPAAAGAELEVEVRAAPWVEVDRVRVWVDGRVARERRGDVRGATVFALHPEADAWAVVEVTGSRSLFPVVTPAEAGGPGGTGALDALAGALGLDGDGFGNLRPSASGPALPYALTNPVYLDVDGDGAWTPPRSAAEASRPGPPDRRRRFGRARPVVPRVLERAGRRSR